MDYWIACSLTEMNGVDDSFVQKVFSNSLGHKVVEEQNPAQRKKHYIAVPSTLNGVGARFRKKLPNP